MAERLFGLAGGLVAFGLVAFPATAGLSFSFFMFDERGWDPEDTNAMHHPFLATVMVVLALAVLTVLPVFAGIGFARLWREGRRAGGAVALAVLALVVGFGTARVLPSLLDALVLIADEAWGRLSGA